MNILITGSNGQLGSEIKAHSDNSSDTYIFTDIAELDITNPEAIRAFIDECKIDVIVNCAAYTNVEKAEDDAQTAEVVNCDAVRNLAEAAKLHNATLIHISTDYVFNGEKNTPYTELETTAPTGVYGRTKLAGEEAVRDSECSHIIIRTSWLYSTYGANFVKTISRLSAEKESINVVFDQAGTPTYAEDLAKAIISIISARSYKDRCDTFHYSNEGVCSWYDFAIEIVRLNNSTCKVQPCLSDEFPTKVARPKYSVLDKSAIKRSLGVEIAHWREALERYFDKINS